MKVDYIIVGCSLAGIAFCEQLRNNNKSFVVFEDNSQHSSQVAAGMYNPVILKRFTEVWKAKEQLDLALPFYKKLETLLKITLDYKLKLCRIFASIEEQNNWFHASDNPNLSSFLSSEIKENTNKNVVAKFGLGKVLKAGRIDTKVLILKYRAFLKESNQLQNESFLYNELSSSTDSITYKNVTANHIVFAEGYGITKNPFFNYLPLNPAKGEVITIKAPDLKLKETLKSSVFILPEGNDLYTVGATYNWKDMNASTTNHARQELVTKLKKFILSDFEVVNQVAGIRPTVKDRRPLVGTHPEHKLLHVLNGLGTRGVMIAPYAAKQLFDFIENGDELGSEINISRFTS